MRRGEESAGERCHELPENGNVVKGLLNDRTRRHWRAMAHKKRRYYIVKEGNNVSCRIPEFYHSKSRY